MIKQLDPSPLTSFCFQIVVVLFFAYCIQYANFLNQCNNSIFCALLDANGWRSWNQRLRTSCTSTWRLVTAYGIHLRTCKCKCSLCLVCVPHQRHQIVLPNSSPMQWRIVRASTSSVCIDCLGYAID